MQRLQFVWYDPLYGVRLIDSSGDAAGVSDIELEITAHGFHTAQWRYQPVRSYGRSLGTPVAAKDPTYQLFNTLDYSIVLENYFNVAVIRYEDSWITGAPLIGEAVAMGRRLVYDNTPKRRLDPDGATSLLQFVIQQSSIPPVSG